MMKTVGNDIVYDELRRERKWYILLGILLLVFGVILLGALGVATLSVIYLFGILMMIGGLLQLFAAFQFFKGASRWLWALFGVLYLLAGYFAFTTPITTAIVLTSLLAIVLVIAGIFRIIAAFSIRPRSGWGWVLFSGILTLVTGILILVSPDAPFWVLGLFLAIDMIFQGINYLSLSSRISHLPEHSKTVD